MAALIIALAHPQIRLERQVAQPRQMDVVFLLDNSPSMRAEDITPSRLERAIQVIGDFSKNMLRDDRMGLVSFSEGSIILSYLTGDSENILYYLEYLKDDSDPNYGTNIGRALNNGLTIFTRDLEVNPEMAGNKRVLILVSDGEDYGEDLEDAVAAIINMGINVHTIGIGSRDGAPIPIATENGKTRYLEDQGGQRIVSRFNEETLRWVAEVTGGNAYRSFTGLELESIFSDIVLEEREIDGFKKIVEHEDVYQRFLYTALGAFILTLLI
jgi:Ca-activated chloride channel family protein